MKEVQSQVLSGNIGGKQDGSRPLNMRQEVDLETEVVQGEVIVAIST